MLKKEAVPPEMTPKIPLSGKIKQVALQEEYVCKLIQDGNPGAIHWQIGQKR